MPFNMSKKLIAPCQHQVFTSRTSIASILIKGSETCKAHILRIKGEIIGSIDAVKKPMVRKKNTRTKITKLDDTNKKLYQHDLTNLIYILYFTK